MQHLQLRCYQALAVIAIFAFLVAIFAFLVWMTKLNIETSVSGQTKLLSRIAADTPVSGFYGPGAWCTWLITLGMSQGHTFMALATTNKLPSVDYDLVAASFYTVAAAIDLMAKSVTIARLGDKAGESVLLPALLCAERVVSLGTGFSLWTIIIALCFGRLSGLRTASIALIPLIFAHVASVFTLRAHQIISRTAPVPWCDMHTQADILADSRVGLYLVDVPSWAIAWNLSMAYSFLEFWKWTATISGVLLLVFFLVTLVRDRNLNSALEKVAVIVVSLLVGILLFYPVCFEVVWLVFLGDVLVADVSSRVLPTDWILSPERNLRPRDGPDRGAPGCCGCRGDACLTADCQMCTFFRRVIVGRCTFDSSINSCYISGQ
ncbi:hypothetical protein B0H14DRAFT_3138993 [Mycena olivaceomarginata]|nr:hypothetical protein B0H14DRAFT_3138993 [Mycena olivaceomarginata]